MVQSHMYIHKLVITVNNYFVRTIPDISGFFAPLEEGLSPIFIPSLTDRSINALAAALEINLQVPACDILRYHNYLIMLPW